MKGGKAKKVQKMEIKKIIAVTGPKMIEFTVIYMG